MSAVFGFLSVAFSNPVVSAVVSAIVAGYVVGRMYGGRPMRDGIVESCDIIASLANGISAKLRPRINPFDDEADGTPFTGLIRERERAQR